MEISCFNYWKDGIEKYGIYIKLVMVICNEDLVLVLWVLGEDDKYDIEMW